MSPWEFACKWYRVEDIASMIRAGQVAKPAPSMDSPDEFAEWISNEYRLAMTKGIEIGRNWDLHSGDDQ